MKIKRFYYMAEGGRLNTLDSVSHEMVYRSVCCWYAPYRKVVVIDAETGKTKIYTRKLDLDENLVCINEMEF